MVTKGYDQNMNRQKLLW